MANKPGTFKKGDPRINRKGRPKNFDKLRELAQAIAHEGATIKGEPVVVNGKKATITEVILRQWAASKNHQLQRAFMEIAFGKVPDKHEIIGDMKITHRDDKEIDRAISTLAETIGERIPSENGG